MKADTYYGRRAREYDSARCHSLRWANEQRAVADMVFSGPVLDCPLGTGRYVGIYRSKGLDVAGVDISGDMIAEAKRNYPDLAARQGSIFSLPFADRTFEAAVCIRLLDWLYPAEMAKAIAELRRVARTIIVSIRHGLEGERVNYTHDLSKFFAECQGLAICARRVTETGADGDIEEIFRLRPPLWRDVEAEFVWHGHTPAFEIYRLAAEWAPLCGFRLPDVLSADTMRVSAEYWEGERLGAVIDAMTAHNSAYRTDDMPRSFDRPATLLRTADAEIVLDGRRRINQWRKTPGLRPVLVIEPCPSAP